MDTSATQAPRRVLRLLVSPAAPAGLWAVPHTPGGDPGAGQEPQGATYSRRRLESPWKTLALRQPMRLLERSLQGKRRGHQHWGHPAAPSPLWAALAGTYRRLSSGRPRKAPGCTVLIRLFFRSLRGDGHRLRVLGALRHHPAPSPCGAVGCECIPFLQQRSPNPSSSSCPPGLAPGTAPAPASSLQEPRPGGKRRWIRITGELPPRERGHAAATTPRPRCCCYHHPPGAERGSSGGRSRAPRAPEEAPWGRWPDWRRPSDIRSDTFQACAGTGRLPGRWGPSRGVARLAAAPPAWLLP